MNCAIYISSHGYGHATRQAALARALQDVGVNVWLCTDRPRFLFGALDPQLTHYREVMLDFGLIQDHWREIDAQTTIAALHELIAQSDSLASSEADWLREQRIDLVIGDIPPLAFEAASRAGVRSVAIGNFDWPFIYRHTLGESDETKALLQQLETWCGNADLALRMPFSSEESMSAFPRVETTGLLARFDYARRSDVRRKLGLDDETLLVLALFGGLGGATIDFDTLCDTPDVTVIAADVADGPDNLTTFTEDSHLPSLLPAVDLVATKLGYSTLAECVCAGAPVLCAHRHGQPEDGILLDGLMKLRHPHAVVSPEELENLDWQATTDLIRQMERPAQHRPANHQIAQRCIEFAFQKVGEKRIVIDMGSNNILLLWAQRDNAIWEASHRASSVSALGRGMRDDLLTTAAIRRARAILDRYIGLSRGFSDQVSVFATSAAREAKNIGEISDWLQRKHGVMLDILSEEDEARCGALAAAASFDGDLFTFDIGGGSTECAIVKRGEVKRWVSLPVGLRRLESFFGVDEKARVRYMREQLAMIDDWDLAGLTPVGLGGTVCNLTAVKLRQQRYDGDAVHGEQLFMEELAEYENALRVMKNEDIARLMPFEPSRAKLVHAGVQWMQMLLARTGAPAITACDRGLTFGYLLLGD